MNKPAELYNGVEICVAKTPGEWRKWLQKNSEEKDSVWLIIYKKQSGIKSVYYPEAVDEALCFGWIDSKAIGVMQIATINIFQKKMRKANGVT
jgi:uncharacterized protein YdeI (YjbR/CyaY-like superfamily)